MAILKKPKAAFLSRVAVKKKSRVFPCLSTARLLSGHWPLTLTSVASILQLADVLLLSPEGDVQL